MFVDEFTGSCGCSKVGSYSGGDDYDLNKLGAYSGSAESKAKEAIVKAIAVAGASLGLLKGHESDSDADKVNHIITRMKSHAEFKTDPKAQRTVCTAIASAINTARGSNVIDLSIADSQQGAEILCRDVAQYLGSLLTGMQSELLAVSGQISAAIKQLYVLKGILEQNYMQVEEKVKVSEDVELKMKMADFDNVHKYAIKAIDQQLEILQNLINVELKPTEKDIALMIDDKLSLDKYLRSLDKKIGTTEFSQALSNLIKMLGTTGLAATMIDNALKRVGMTRDQYRNLPGLEKFEQVIDENYLSQKLPFEEANEYIKAAELLRKNFSSRQNIGKEGKGETMENFTGGAMMSADKRGKVLKETQKIIFQSFFRNMDTLLKQLAGSIDVLSMKIGDEIPVSDKLDDLAKAANAYARDSSLTERSNWRYLLGYYLDAGAKARKENALMTLKTLSKELDELMAMDMYRGSNQYFNAVSNIIKSIMSLIDRYSNEVNARFGQFEGGADEAEIDAQINTPRFRSTVNIEDSMKKLSYRMKVAQIYRNLAASGRDLKEYGEKYDNLVSNSIAEKLRADMAKYENQKLWLKNDGSAILKSDKSTDAVAIVADATSKLSTAAGDAAKTKAAMEIINAEARKQQDDAEKFASQQWEAKRKFWATVEAIDSYMKVFTDAIVNNPNDIQDIKSMLDDIEVIAEWYTEGAGNTLANVFDQFPSTGKDVTNKSVDEESSKIDANSGSEHYYKKFEGKDLAKAVEAPGMPFNVAWPSKGLDARNKLKDMFKSMSALKNLLSIFVHVGSKFGGDELRKKIFMTPTQIYNNLVEYFAASAFAQGWNIKADALAKGPATGANSIKDLTNVAVDATTNIKAAWGISMRSVAGGTGTRGAALTTIHAAQGASFDLEDKHFTYILKAIAAKILTVTGTYDVFDRPLDANSNSIGIIRMILGGSSDVPKVEEAAVPLYIRLPLLCHFYKDLFGYDTNDDWKDEGPYSPLKPGKNSKITFVPDVDGTYAGLIRLMFRKIKSDDISTYNEEDVKDLIRECNLIYQKAAAKNSQDPVMTAIYGLVDEVNRRYGVVVQADRAEYEKVNDRFYSTGQYSKETLQATDYALLPGEEDDEVSQLSGAERLLGTKLEMNLDNKDRKKYGIDDKHFELLRNFRCKIDQLLNGNYTTPFKEAIKAAQHKIKNAKDDNGRFKVAGDLIRGFNLKVQLRSMASIMFHETVIAGLNTLSAVHTLLAQFRLRSLIINREWLEDRFVGTVKNTDTANTIAGYIAAALNAANLTANATDGKIIALAEKFVNKATANAPDADAIKAYRASKDPKTDATGIALSLLFNEPAMMEELVENLQTFANDFQGLINIKFDAGNMYVNYGGLKTLIEELFAHVNSYMQLLQYTVDESLYKRYNGNEPGQFLWLQEQLLNKIIVGRPNKFENTTDRDYDNLDVVFKGLSYTYRRLTERDDQSYGNLFAKMIYYDASQANSGLKMSTEAGESDKPKLIDWHDAYDSLHLDGPPGKQTLDTRYAARFAQLYTWKSEFTGNRSLLFGFNQLVAKYIQCLYDPATQKMYNGAINTFANSMFSRALADPQYTYPDTQVYIWNREYDPRTVPTAPLGADTLTAIRGERAGTVSQANEDEVKAMLMDAVIAPLGKLDNRNQLIRGNFAQRLLELLLAIIVHAAVSNAAEQDSAEARALYALVQKSAAPITYAAFNAGNIHDSVEKIFKTIVRINAPGRLKSAFQDADDVDVALNGNVAKFAGAIPAVIVTVLNKLELGASEKNWEQANDALNEIEPYADADKDATMTQLAALMAAFYNKDSNGRKRIMSIVRANIKPGTQYKGPYSAQSELHPKFEDLYLTGKGSTSAPANIIEAADTDYGKINGLPTGDTTDPNVVEKFGQRKDPDSDHILFTSLAHILRTITSTRTHQNQALVYLFDNVADLPLYLKEKMRANLPMFRNMFKALSQRAEFIREFYTRKQIRLDRDLSKFTADVNPWPFGLKDLQKDSTLNKNRFSGIIDVIVRGCQMLATACDQQLKEIGDDPKYLEVYQNSIRDYRNQYGNDPLMPLTSTLTILRNDNVSTGSELDGNKYLPVYSVGEVQFKWHYGVRSLIHQPTTIPLLEHVIGFADIIENYNIAVDGKYQIDKSKADSFLKSYTRALRWVYEQRAIRRLLTSYEGALSAGSLLTDLTGLADDAAKSRSMLSINEKANLTGNVANPVFSVANELTTVIRLTENPTKEERIEELARHIVGDSKDDNLGKKLAVANIIDLNIVPINVHALMREIPLANLYNYAYTFDRLVIDTYYGKMNDKQAADMIVNLCENDLKKKFTPKNSLDMLVSLLVDPYRSIEDNEYDSMFRPMMLGAALNGELGRPKFLSDQVLGKALFDSPYADQFGPKHEVGPAADRRPGVLTITIEQAKAAVKAVLDAIVAEQFKDDAAGIPGGHFKTAAINTTTIMSGLFKSTRNSIAQLIAGGMAPAVALMARAVQLYMFNGIDKINKGMMNATELGKQLYHVVKVLCEVDGNAKYGLGADVKTILAKMMTVADGDDAIDELLANEINAAAATVNAADLQANKPDKPAVLELSNEVVESKSSERIAGVLTYLDDNDLKIVKADSAALAVVGRDRLDTVAVRNLIFITNLYRTVRLRLQRDLVYSRDIIQRSAPITAESLTEFAMNQSLKNRSRK